jgi:signal transduction histidine kinase
MKHSDQETSTEAKARVAASIEEARADLDRALAQLEQLPAIDSSTIGYVAHALNNYLTVNTITVEMLQATLRDHPNPDVRMWLDGIHHATDLMHHTIATLLLASSPGDFPLKLETINLHILMSRASHYFRPIANRKQINVVYRSIGDIPLVRADRVAVAVVAENLLSNAIKYSKTGTTVHVNVVAEPRYAVCTVRDEGPGISPEDQARLFLKGVTLSAVPTGGESSAGFGLAMVKEFIDRLGGSLWCESELGRGSRFSFRLPAEE